MGDSEEGGGGSVFWKLEAKKAKNESHVKVGKKVDQKGEDEDDNTDLGYHLTISFLKPNGLTQGQFLTHLQSPQGLKLSTKDNKRVFFNLPIENKKAQIRVSWGQSEHHEGTGGKRPLARVRKGVARRKKPQRSKR